MPRVLKRSRGIFTAVLSHVNATSETGSFVGILHLPTTRPAGAPFDSERLSLRGGSLQDVCHCGEKTTSFTSMAECVCWSPRANEDLISNRLLFQKACLPRFTVKAGRRLVLRKCADRFLPA